MTLVACQDVPLLDSRAASVESDLNPMPREDLRQGGTLRWGITELPTQWNPYHPQGNVETVTTVLEGLMPSPFVLDSGGTPHPDPDYVVDYSVSVDERQTLRLSLNPEARWSTGDPITWRDYAALATALGGDDQRFHMVSPVGYDRIAEVAPGENQFEVVVVFDEPYSEYASLFYPLLPAETTSDPDAFNEDFRETIPVTAGPFTLDNIDPTARTVTVTRDDDWWGEPAMLDGITYRALETGAFEGAFLEGGIDVFTVPTETSSFLRTHGAADGEVRAAPGQAYRHLTLNGAAPALSDVRVRQAIFHGVDRRALADAALGGIGWPVEMLNNRLLLPNRPGYADNSGDLSEYDPDAASALLDDAGWPRPESGEGVRVRDGETLTLRMVVPRGHAAGRDEAALIRDMLEEIGVEVLVEEVSGDELFSTYVFPGNYDLVAFNYAPGAFPVTATRYQWAEQWDGDWAGNVSKIGDPAIDENLDAALATLDPDQSTELINEADRLLWENGHTLPLYQRPQLVAVRDDVANLGATGLGSLRHADIGYVAAPDDT
ncbi:ABC transporter family substrate-binding protein [Spiractinospora alimapuensis]|uniref:ABC transporter family substrate-binding protein n=1 Tax=Spiractinospora alimapuensis TaxID=2820884 RepID=UPI001F1C9ED8|nr:ABC transporter family substrate-binding protein [Spiractinospora alimapuensis]